MGHHLCSLRFLWPRILSNFVMKAAYSDKIMIASLLVMLCAVTMPKLHTYRNQEAEERTTNCLLITARQNTSQHGREAAAAADAAARYATQSHRARTRRWRKAATVNLLTVECDSANVGSCRSSSRSIWLSMCVASSSALAFTYRRSIGCPVIVRRANDARARVLSENNVLAVHAMPNAT